MSAKKKNGDLLSSWKEIAKYLKCGERTCRRWEQNYGLPIHRIDDNSKTTVFAYKDELDEWLQSRRDRTIISTDKSKWYKSPYLFLPMIIVGLFLLYFFFMRKAIDLQPYDFKISNSILRILTEENKELWHYDTGIHNLKTEDFYRDCFQNKKIAANKYGVDRTLPYLMIKDINNDGNNEVLFSIQTEDELREDVLHCFDHKGQKLWEYTTGKELKFGRIIYSSDYRVHGFDVNDIDNDGSFEIIVFSYHKPDFPCQLLVLNSEGNKLGEYWNSGQLKDTAYVDLDNDGIKEIIIAGMNNEYAKSCLIVFDANSIKGCSPQKKDFWLCKELAPGSERCYILFPHIDIALLKALMEPISLIDVLKNSRLKIMTGASAIYYELNSRLELQNIRLSHRFQLLYREALKDRKITKELNQEKYIQELSGGLLYWDGQNWVTTPTMTANWK